MKEFENKEIEVTEGIVEETEVKEGFISKVKTIVKKHGKKIAVGTAVTIGGVLCYSLGKKSNNNFDDIYDEEIIDLESIDDSEEKTEE